MQNVLPLTPGNPLRNITGLARQISLPGEHVPLRFPSFPALERTAVMGFNQPATLDIPTGRLTSLTLFRQATYPLWADVEGSVCYMVDVSIQTPQSFTHLVVGRSDYTLLPRTAYGSWTIVGRAAGQTVPGLNINAAVAPNQYITPTWPIYGADGMGIEYLYVPAGCSWYVQLSSNSAFTDGIDASVTMEVWSSPGETSTFTVPITGANGHRCGATTGTAAIGTWLRIASISVVIETSGSTGSLYTASILVANGAVTFAGNALTGGTFTVAAPTDAYMHLPLVGPSEFSNSALPWFATRVTAAAILGTNVTQVLNKGGTVLAGRVSPAVQNAWSITSSYINALHPAEKAFLPLETGVYTYAPPSTDLVFFSDYTLNTSGGASPAPLFRLNNDSLYNKVYLSPGSVAETMACTVTWHIEFRTSSALFQIGLSAMTLESLHQAQLVLAESGFFFENPEHEGLLNKVISNAKKYAPSVVSAVNPMAGKLLQVAMSQMNSKVVKPKPGPSMPAATSAAKSGMMAKPKAKKGNTQKKGNKKK